MFITLFSISAFAQVKFIDLSLDEAQDLAKNNNKKIMIDFYTDWCMPCKDLDKYIFADSLVSNFINKNYVCLKINAESEYGKDIGEKLNLQEAYPTVIFLNNDKTEIDRIIGLMSEEEYFQIIKDYTNNINTFNKLLQKEKEEKSNLKLKEKVAKKYFERGLFSDAIKYYKTLTNSEEFNSDGIISFIIGRCYFFDDDIKNAKKYVEEAISKNPKQKYYNEFLTKLNKN